MAMAIPQKVTGLLVLGSKPFARVPRNVNVHESGLD
jgi:hypothetical protein